jgi:hypothetical protein
MPCLNCTTDTRKAMSAKWDFIAWSRVWYVRLRSSSLKLLFSLARSLSFVSLRNSLRTGRIQSTKCKKSTRRKRLYFRLSRRLCLCLIHSKSQTRQEHTTVWTNRRKNSYTALNRTQRAACRRACVRVRMLSKMQVLRETRFIVEKMHFNRLCKKFTASTNRARYTSYTCSLAISRITRIVSAGCCTFSV